MSEPVHDQDEVEVRLGLVRRRYGDRLTPEQLDILRHVVKALVEQVAALRAVPLTNADGPMERFIPFRADE